MLNVLLVEDEAATQAAIAHALTEAGHRVTLAGDGEEALALAADHVFDVAVCDVHLPKLDGLALFRRIRIDSPGTAVILMTAYATVPDAVSALQEGAYDYVIKPFDPGAFTQRVIGRLAERRALRQELEHARAQLAAREVGAQILGSSAPMVRLIDRIDSLAHSEAAVLITGEPGTGKGLVARTLHARSARRVSPFVVVDCTAFPEAMLEAELFGHERSPSPAAPARRARREGRLEAAHGGTLLLREVGTLPLAEQDTLLEALQTGKLLPPGARAEVDFDARVMASSHQDLRARVAEGAFREDLYYRLSVLEIHLPPLRERRQDLALLLQHFLQRYTKPTQIPPEITPKAWALLSEYSFPGNVRELAQTVEHALALARGGEIDVQHLSEDIIGAARASRASSSAFQPLREVLKEAEREHVLRALHLAGGKRARAAQLLGISRKSLWEKLIHHGLSDVRVDERA